MAPVVFRAAVAALTIQGVTAWPGWRVNGEGVPHARRDDAHPYLPVFDPADDGTLRCPDNDRDVFVRGGDTYTVTCYEGYRDHNIHDSRQRVKTVSLEACAAYCSSTPNCAAANWVPDSVDSGICIVKYAVGEIYENKSCLGLIKNNHRVYTRFVTTSSSSNGSSTDLERAVTFSTSTTTVTGPPQPSDASTSSTSMVEPSTTIILTSTISQSTDATFTLTGPPPPTTTSTKSTTTITVTLSESDDETSTTRTKSTTTITVVGTPPGHTTTVYPTTCSPCESSGSQQLTTTTQDTTVVVVVTASSTADSGTTKISTQNKANTQTVRSKLPYTASGYTSTITGGDVVTIIEATPANPPVTITKTIKIATTESGFTSTVTDAATSYVYVEIGTTNAPVATPGPKTPWVPCGVLNHKSNTFHLRSHVIYGSKRFESLYVQDVLIGGTSTVPLLSVHRDSAAHVYYDMTSSSVAIFQGGCQFAGFVMVRDRDLNAMSPVFIENQVGTAKMTIADGDLWWDNDRFGSWLACEGLNNQVTLSWWDVVTNQGVDTERCAKIQLLTENL